MLSSICNIKYVNSEFANSNAKAKEKRRVSERSTQRVNQCGRL